MEKVFNGHKEGVIMFNSSWDIMFANRYMLSTLGYDSEEIKRLNGNTLICSFDDCSDNIYERILNWNSSQARLKLFTKGGGTVEYITSINMLDCGHNMVVVVHAEDLNDINLFNNRINYIVNNLYEHNYSEAVKELSPDEILKRLIQELKRSKEIELELELFLNTAVDLLAIIDENGNFIKVNDRWTSTLGWTKDEMLSFNARDLIYEADMQECDGRRLFAKNTDEILRYRNKYKCKNGKLRSLEWRSRYISDLKKYVCTATDITDVIELEEKYKKNERELQIEKVRSEFFSNISHEFKTPLSIIIATIQLINRNIDMGDVKIDQNSCIPKYINSIRQNAYRLVKLVNNIGDLSKIEAGYYDINLEKRNIVEVVEDITLSVAQYIENKERNLVFDTDIEELVMAFDPEKIERIMLNLLSNAIKHTDKDGEIRVELNCNREYVNISVSDNGIGIPKEKVPYVFERFVQVDEDISRKREGCGIGLALVKYLVEMHNGKINVESKEKFGTKFSVILPILDIADDNSHRENLESANSKVEKCIIEFSDIYS